MWSSPDDLCRAAIAKDDTLDTAWIDETHPYQDEAIEICLECPVRLLCLQNALEDEEAEGIRGGFWFDSGTVPVADARHISTKLGLTLSPWQKTSGRRVE
jgi:Transcription factor WhiB